MRDYRDWHRAYDDPDSTLSRRLVVVRRYVAEVLTALPADRPLRVLSLCAGDGRDLVPVLAELRQPVAAATLVELDPELSATARRDATAAGLEALTVITGDAGSPAVFADAWPVDLLLLCGIFGNVAEADIRTTVAAAPALLAPGGSVIWTRGSMEPDLRPAIRRWFAEAGLTEVAFASEPQGYGVGVAQRPRELSVEAALPERLFTFLR